MEIIFDGIIQLIGKGNSSPAVSALAGLFFMLFLAAGGTAVTLKMQRQTERGLKCIFSDHKCKTVSSRVLTAEDGKASAADEAGSAAGIVPVLMAAAAWLSFANLPVSATHCNLPSKCALSCFDSEAGLFYTAAAVIAVMILPGMAVCASGPEESFHIRRASAIFWDQRSVLFPWLAALAGPVIMSGSMRVSDIVEVQSLSIFDTQLAGWFIIPGCFGAAVCFMAMLHFAAPNFPCPGLPAHGDPAQELTAALPAVQKKLVASAQASALFVMASLFVDVFLGGWELPGVTYPVFANLGFLVMPHVDLCLGIIVFSLKVLLILKLVSLSRLSLENWIAGGNLQYFKFRTAGMWLLSGLGLAVCTAAAAVSQIYFGGSGL